jgi:hypothetical protein
MGRHDTQHNGSVLLSHLYADCRKLAVYAECHYAECHYECPYAECHYECHYAECHYESLCRMSL